MVTTAKASSSIALVVVARDSEKERLSLAFHLCRYRPYLNMLAPISVLPWLTSRDNEWMEVVVVECGSTPFSCSMVSNVVLNECLPQITINCFPNVKYVWAWLVMKFEFDAEHMMCMQNNKTASHRCFHSEMVVKVGTTLLRSWVFNRPPRSLWLYLFMNSW